MSAAQGSMLHLQGNMQHSPLGISIINTHSGSVSFQRDNSKEIRSVDIFGPSDHQISLESVSQMSPFSINGLPSPGFQCPTTAFQPTPQQVYSLTQTGQQVQEGCVMRLTLILVLKSSNYQLFGNARKSLFFMCVRPLLVSNWWHLQQRLIQQPKFIPTTSSGSTRTRSAAEDFPQANLFVQVRPSVPDNPNNRNIQNHIQMDASFIFMSAV